MGIKIHYIFIVYILVLYFLNLFDYYLIFFLCILIHELTHACVGSIYGLKVKDLSISITGLSINFNHFNISRNKKVIILLSGPIINLIIGIITYLLFKEQYMFFVISNIILFIFNVLPIYPLDGGRIIYELLIYRKDKERLIQLIEKCFIIVFIIFCIYCYINFYAIQILFLGLYMLGFVNNKKYI